MTETVFEARGLTKVYGEGELAVHALRGVDIELYAGEIVVLLGASGSGKSTLLNILGGLDTASGGTVHYRDLDLVAASERQLTRYRRDHVGFVFQFYNLIASLTARENVAVATEIAPDPMPPDEALAMVDLKTVATIFRRSYPVASSSEWQLPERSPSALRCCFATNRPARSIRKPVSAYWRHWRE